MKSNTSSKIYGFTIPEAMIAISIGMVVLGMVFIVFTAGLHLYAKNTAVNSAHQQARSGVDQLLQNIHSSVSIPQLVEIDTTVTPNKFKPIPDPGVGPSGGLSFQLFDRGPYPVVENAAATATSLVISFHPDTYAPQPNLRVNIPNHDIELDVVSATSLGSGKWRLSFASPIGKAVTISEGGDDDEDDDEVPILYVVNAFMTKRVSYAVVDGQMRYYPTNDLSTYKVIARNITSEKPFKVPTLEGGLRNRYVAAVQLSTVEPKYTERGYAAVNMFINSLIPFRSRLTTRQ